MTVRKTVMVLVAGGFLGANAWAHCGKCGVGDAQHEHRSAEIGAVAPDFTLTSTDGKEVRLAEYKGKVVVLEWTNHTCPFVQRHVAHDKTMQKMYERYQERGVAWLAVDSSYFCEDKLDDVKAFAAKSEVPYPILLDPTGEVGHQYGAKTTPHMMVINQKGELIYSGAIDDDPRGANENPRNYVAEAIDAALNGSTVPVASTKSYGCGVKYAQ